MNEKLELLLREGKEKILSAKTEVALQEIKAALLGKKGSLTELMKELPKLSPEERPVMGQLANAVRAEIEAKLEAYKKTADAGEPVNPEVIKFCHNCGSEVGADDAFCKSCGSSVK